MNLYHSYYLLSDDIQYNARIHNFFFQLTLEQTQVPSLYRGADISMTLAD